MERRTTFCAVVFVVAPAVAVVEKIAANVEHTGREIVIVHARCFGVDTGEVLASVFVSILRITGTGAAITPIVA